MPEILSRAISEQASGLFEPEVVTILGSAYEKATTALHDKGRLKAVREVLANRILTLAETGEGDPDILAKSALESFGLRLD